MAKGKGFVLASFDLIGLTRDFSDRIRTRMVQELGVDWNLVVLNTSHTHSGPYMLRSLMAGSGRRPRWRSTISSSLEEQLVWRGRAAGGDAAGAGGGVSGDAPRLGINRRGKTPQGRQGMVPDPTAPFDDKIWSLKLTPRDGGSPGGGVFLRVPSGDCVRLRLCGDFLRLPRCYPQTPARIARTEGARAICPGLCRGHPSPHPGGPGTWPVPQVKAGRCGSGGAGIGRRVLAALKASPRREACRWTSRGQRTGHSCRGTSRRRAERYEKMRAKRCRTRTPIGWPWRSTG